VRLRLAIFSGLTTLLIAGCASRECCRGTVPGATDTLSAAAKSMRDRGLAAGLREDCLPWRTAEESREWQRTMPPWMKKIDIAILDLARFLKEKNLLVPARRQLAVEFSTRMVPVDSLARIKVLCTVHDQEGRLTEKYFKGICADLVDHSHGWLTVWVCPEKLQTLAERREVLKIGSFPIIEPHWEHGHSARP
jgi:hypothetical protein